MCEGEISTTPDTRDQLLYYAQTVDINRLYLSIEQHPQILQDFDKTHFSNTPLHAAAAAGNTEFAIEILNLMPSFGNKLNPNGLSPLHLALMNFKYKTAKALVRFDAQLVRVKGKGGFTPLHHAAANIRTSDEEKEDLDVLATFLLECPDSIYDLNNKFQSAVHLVMGSGSCEGIKLILNWLVRMAREPVLGLKDGDGNTPLHIAVQHGCVQGVEIMVTTAKINKRNSDHMTPLDIADKQKNRQMVALLTKAKARKGIDLRKKESSADYLRSETNILETVLRGFCFMLKDLTVEMRNVVLVVAVLIATATYQSVLSPPGGVYQDEGGSDNNSPTAAAAGRGALQMAAVAAPSPDLFQRSKLKSHLGKMVMSKSDYDMFMPTNTAAFTLSLVMIIFVLHGRPYNIILHACLLFLAFSYLFALTSISQSNGVTDLTVGLAWYAIAGAFAAKMLYYVLKALFEDVWWLPRCAVGTSNISNRVTWDWVQKIMTFLRKLRRQCKLILSTGKYY